MEDKIKVAGVWYDKNKNLYEQFSCEIEEIITKILKQQEIPYQSIGHRVKEKESYLNKCQKYANPVEEIMDVSGIRIIAYTNQDVKNICKVIEKEFFIDKKNSGNKADALQTNEVGYLSIHYILQLNEKRLELAENEAYKGMRCEVQVRTLLQHAWAEIEHDRNYKFAGVLPNEIKRRFHLVAGVLEMMDSEFDRLSKDIDEYSKNMKNAVLEGNLNLSIDSKSLEQYVLKRFEDIEYINACVDGTVVSENVVGELLRFGYKTIQDIEDDLNKYLEIFTEDEERTYIGIFRDIMILRDCDKYFKVAYTGDWRGTSKKSVRKWKDNGIENIEKYLKQNCISIK